MMQQSTFLDVLLPPPAIIRHPVDPNGPVIKDRAAIDEVIEIVTPRPCCSYACIELHQHSDGLWMWGQNVQLGSSGGGGYRVGPKWGKFAHDRDAALYWAKEEVRQSILGRASPKEHSGARKLLSWVNGLR